jgi:hypothetical protein
MGFLLFVIGIGLCMNGHFIVGFVIVFAGWNWKG